MNVRKAAPWAAALAALLFAALWSAPAQASLIRNPVQDVRSGQMQVGFGLSRDTLSLFWDLGLSEAGTLDVEVSNLDIGGGDSATVIGFGYRHEINRKANVADKSIRLAPYGILSFGTGNADFTTLDLGFGGSLPIEQQFAAFGSADFRYVDTPGGSDSRIGVILGGEWRPTADWHVGAEIHLGFEDDSFGIYTALRF